MAHCPSQDWDAYNAGQEAGAEAEIRFWAQNKDRILQVACAILANPNVDPFAIDVSSVIDKAEKVVSHVVMTRCGEEY